MYFDHANNYWVAAVSLGHKGGKRVRRKVTGRTKTEVKAKLRDLRRDLDKGVRSSASYTVGNALDDWLAGGLNGRSDRTRELYRDTVKPLRERVGADNPVTAADLVALCRTRTLELGIWLREGLTLRHCQYPCHYDSLIWRCCACSAGSPCLPGPTAPRTPRS